jgi:hypothetical protein
MDMSSSSMSRIALPNALMSRGLRRTRSAPYSKKWVMSEGSPTKRSRGDLGDEARVVSK